MNLFRGHIWEIKCLPSWSLWDPTVKIKKDLMEIQSERRKQITMKKIRHFLEIKNKKANKTQPTNKQNK